MNDLFASLAARNSGAAAALRPRVASHYEPRVEAVEEVPATTADRPEPIVVRDVVVREREAEGRAESPSYVEADVDVNANVNAKTTETATVTRTATASATENLNENENKNVGRALSPPPIRVTEPSTIETIRERRIAVPSAAHLLPAEAGRRGTETATETEIIIDRVREVLAPAEPGGILPEERPPRERATVRVREALAAEPPVVHVTIGRVEVRAIHPQPQPRPAPPPAPSGPTLEEFLAQRDRRQS